jgi:hypothetical protein
VECTKRLCVRNTFVETRERVGGCAINGDWNIKSKKECASDTYNSISRLTKRGRSIDRGSMCGQGVGGSMERHNIHVSVQCTLDLSKKSVHC